MSCNQDTFIQFSPSILFQWDMIQCNKCTDQTLSFADADFKCNQQKLGTKFSLDTTNNKNITSYALM